MLREVVFVIFAILSRCIIGPELTKLTGLQAAVSLPYLIWVMSLICLRRFRTLAILSQEEDVRDDISSVSTLSFCFHPKSDLDMWLTLCVRIVLGVLSKTLDRMYM